MGFNYMNHPTLNCVDDFLLGGIGFDCEEELMLCVYESFYMEYEV